MVGLLAAGVGRSPWPPLGRAGRVCRLHTAWMRAPCQGPSFGYYNSFHHETPSLPGDVHRSLAEDGGGRGSPGKGWRPREERERGRHSWASSQT